MIKLIIPIIFCLSACVTPSESVSEKPILEVGFSPPAPNQIGCTERIVKHIDSAKRTIYVQAFSFTDPKISDALVAAHKKIPQVKVKIILDKSNEHDKHSQMEKMLANHVSVFLDHKHAIAHNKILIIDSEEVETGSANYTRAMNHSNAENCLFVRDKQLTTEYTSNWFRHLEHSVQAH